MAGGDLEHTLSQDDHGDDTQRRFRYQTTYAAYLAACILRPGSNIVEVFCEHHDDILLKMSTGRFQAVQVKTREGGTPFKATDKAIQDALCKFIAHERMYGSDFEAYEIATNHQFFDDPSATSLCLLSKLVQRTTPATTHDCDRRLATFIAQLVSSLKDSDDVDNTTHTHVWSMMRKLRLNHQAPKLDDISGLVRDALCQIDKEHIIATVNDLNSAADRLIAQAFLKSSLYVDRASNLYLQYTRNPKRALVEQTIHQKRFTKDAVLKILTQTESSCARDRNPVIQIVCPEDDMFVLTFGKSPGQISVAKPEHREPPKSVAARAVWTIQNRSLMLSQVLIVLLLGAMLLASVKIVPWWSAWSRVSPPSADETDSTLKGTVSPDEFLRLSPYKGETQAEFTHLPELSETLKELVDVLGSRNTIKVDLTQCGRSVRNNELSQICRLANLKVILLSGSSALTDISCLAECAQLEFLDLSNTSVTDLAALASLSQMTSLNLKGTPIENLIDMSTLTRLEMIDLSESRIRDLQPICGSSSIKVLALNNTMQLKEMALCEMENLWKVDLDGSSATKVSFDNVPKLGELKIASTRATTIKIGPLKELTYIHILKNDLLTSIQVRECSALDDVKVFDNLLLETVELCDLPAVTFIGVGRNGKDSKRLSIQFKNVSPPKILDLGGNTSLAEIVLPSLEFRDKMKKELAGYDDLIKVSESSVTGH